MTLRDLMILFASYCIANTTAVMIISALLFLAYRPEKKLGVSKTR